MDEQMDDWIAQILKSGALFVTALDKVQDEEVKKIGMRMLTAAAEVLEPPEKQAVSITAIKGGKGSLTP